MHLSSYARETPAYLKSCVDDREPELTKIDQDFFTYSPYEILLLRSDKSIAEQVQKRMHGDFLKKAAVKK